MMLLLWKKFSGAEPTHEVAHPLLTRDRPFTRAFETSVVPQPLPEPAILHPYKEQR